MIPSKFTRLALALTALLFLAVACRQAPKPPAPDMTATSGSGSGMGSDWVDPTLIDRPTGDTPPMRSGAFDLTEGERLEGILPAVYFDFDQSAIRPADRSVLQEAADYLLGNPNSRLLIEGHCDWRGTTEYNMALGERRAASARDYLISLGIAPDRVEIVSMGDLEADQVSIESELQEDRRADLIVVR